MPQHDFSQLFERYPAIISQLPDRFDSHEFILRLAQQNQKLYTEALYHYRDSSEPAVPFMDVHGKLAQYLKVIVHPPVFIVMKKMIYEQRSSAIYLIWKKKWANMKQQKRKALLKLWKQCDWIFSSLATAFQMNS